MAAAEIILFGMFDGTAPSPTDFSYMIQAGQCYVPGARAGQVVPNSVSADSYMPGATEGDVE